MEWRSSLGNAWILYRRGELSRKALVRAFVSSLGEIWSGSRYGPRSPRFVLSAAVLALGALAILSHGFSGTRALFRPLPVRDPERLVMIRYTGSAGQPAGVPPRLIPGWQEHASLVSAIAAYWHRPFTSYARVTTNFFEVLGTRAAQGRLFRADDRDVAVISEAYWQSAFAADSHVLGRSVRIEGRRYTVTGILPHNFWAITPRVGIWIPLQLDRAAGADTPALPVLIPVIGRLKEGVSREALRTDLFNASRAAHQFVPRRPEVVAFTGVPGPLLPGYLLGFAFAVAVAGVIIARQQGVHFHRSARYRRFWVLKTLLVTAIPVLAWIESGSTGVVFTVLFVGASSLAVWWSFADQRRRCPECLERLALPVRIGSWSSVLEPVTTEFVCEAGHGSLCVPETDQGEPDRWTVLDASWRELFEKVPPEK